MITKKRIIKRNLPINDTYKFISVTDLGEMNFNTCNNCNKPIRYVVELKNSSDKSFFVGTECSKTLQGCNISNEFAMAEELAEFKKLSTAKNLFLKGSEIKIFAGSDYAVLVGLNSSGTAKKINVSPVWNLMEQKNYSFIDSFINELKNSKNVISKNWCYNDVFKYHDKLKALKN